MKKTISRALLHDVTAHPGFELAKHWHKQQKHDLADPWLGRSGDVAGAETFDPPNMERAFLRRRLKILLREAGSWRAPQSVGRSLKRD